MKKLILLIIVVFLFQAYFALNPIPSAAGQTSGEGKNGITILSTMTDSAADVYIFRDSGELANYISVPGNLDYMFDKKSFSKKKMTALQKAGNASYGKAIKSACKRYTVDPDLVRAVIKAESNFNPEAVSPKGAMGLMQLMPDTAREMGVSDPFNPVQNIHGGVGYLSRLLKSLNGDLSLALAAYNAGPERVRSYKGIPPFQETLSYITRVLD
jgi:soluble lytic murein transglycosylase-like protein